tara:strand:+ start:159 stop:464 length:306 start_codon:yes stop_codon:yes gene_type:complete
VLQAKERSNMDYKYVVKNTKEVSTIYEFVTDKQLNREGVQATIMKLDEDDDWSLQTTSVKFKDKATNKYHKAKIVGKPDSEWENSEQRLALLEGELFGEEE